MAHDASVHQLAVQQALPPPRRTKRREGRFTFPMPILALGFDASGRVFNEMGTTRNVSRHGCCFHLDKMPDPNSAIAVHAMPRAGSLNGHPHVLCEIVWLLQMISGWDIGIRVLGDEGIWSLAFPVRRGA